MHQPSPPESDEGTSASLKSSAVQGLEYPVAEWHRQGRVSAEVRIGAGRYDDRIGDATSGIEVFFPYLRIVPRAKHGYWLGTPPFDEKRLDGLCDILLLFSTTLDNKHPEAVLLKHNIKDWNSLLRPQPNNDEMLLPFDEHDAGQSIAAKMEKALDLTQTNKIICHRLDYLAREHPALLMLPAVHCAARRTLRMAKMSTPHERASAMLQVSHFLQACEIKLGRTQGRVARSDINAELSQFAAIDEAITILRDRDQSPVGQSPQTKETALRARVHAAVTGKINGKKMSLKDAKRQMTHAMGCLRDPLSIGKKKLNLAWSVPYSVPFADHFGCHPNIEELQWGLARWLHSQRFAEVRSLLDAGPDQSITMSDRASFFGGHRDGVEITQVFRDLMKLTSDDGHPLPVAMVTLGLRKVALLSFRDLSEQQSGVLAAALSDSMGISEREGRQLLDSYNRLQRAVAQRAASLTQRFMEVNSLPKGRPLPERVK